MFAAFLALGIPFKVMGLVEGFTEVRPVNALPYRLWHIYSDEQPNLHKNINILKYVLICFSAALSVSWFLGFGLYYFFGTWIEEIYTYVLFINFGFSVGLGAHLLIMLSSDDVKIACVQRPKKYLILKNDKLKKKHSCNTYPDYGGNHGMYTCISFFTC